MTPLDYNGWFASIVLALVILWKLDFFTTLLNLRSMAPRVPAEFVDVIDTEKYEQSKDYTRIKASYSVGVSIFMIVVFFTFWWLGGFGWLDEKVRAFGFGSLITGLIYIGFLFVALEILTLPLAWYSIFHIETKFGFNKMTRRLFLRDFILKLILTALLTTPLLLAILWLFESLPMAWFYGWLLTSLYMWFVIFIYPTAIMPLFNKFTPLEEGELKREIISMAEKCDFPVKEISMIDGSKRSTKANAFFTGFGPTKRIALFDTLIKNHTVPELVAVLAHEIGHFKKRHIVKGMVIAIASSGAMFFLLGLLMENRSLFNAFGVKETSVYVSLVLFMILMRPVDQILGIAGNWLSRKHEFEADHYAATVTNRPDAMASALRKLSVDNLTHLTPHPAYVFLNYSHPPASERITALRD